MKSKIKLRKKKHPDARKDRVFPLYLNERELRTVAECVEYYRNEHSDGDTLKKVHDEVIQMLDLIANGMRKGVNAPPMPEDSDRYRFPTFLSYLLQVGNLIPVAQDSPIYADNYKLACYIESSISQQARRDLEREIADVKAEIYDCHKSMRADAKRRNELAKENRLLQDRHTHAVYKADAMKDKTPPEYPLYCSEKQLGMIADHFEDTDEGVAWRNSLARKLARDAQEIIEEINDESDNAPKPVGKGGYDMQLGHGDADDVDDVSDNL